MIDRLPSKCKTLNSNPSTTKRIKKTHTNRYERGLPHPEQSLTGIKLLTESKITVAAGYGSTRLHSQHSRG
jgi:hypothetical protein